MSEVKEILKEVKLVKTVNMLTVLQVLYHQRVASRAYLMEATKLSLATITRIINQLINEQIIVEEKSEVASGGRRPMLVRLNYEQLFVAGVQVAREQIALAFYDLQGSLRIKKILSLESFEPEKVVAEVRATFFVLLESTQLEHQKILGVGLAVSGIVNQEKGILEQSLELNWVGIPIVKMFEEALGLKVWVENNLNVAAIGELFSNNLQSSSNLLYLKIFPNIGAGVLLSGKLPSSKGMAGEIGYLQLFQNNWTGLDEKCFLVNESSLLELPIDDLQMRQWLFDSNQELLTLNFFGDLYVKMFFEETLEILTKTIALLTLMLNLDMVIISGVKDDLREQFIKIIKREVLKNIAALENDKKVEIQLAQSNEEAELLGASMMVIEKLFR